MQSLQNRATLQNQQKNRSVFLSTGGKQNPHFTLKENASEVYPWNTARTKFPCITCCKFDLLTRYCAYLHIDFFLHLPVFCKTWSVVSAPHALHWYPRCNSLSKHRIQDINVSFLALHQTTEDLYHYFHIHRKSCRDETLWWITLWRFVKT